MKNRKMVEAPNASKLSRTPMMIAQHNKTDLNTTVLYIVTRGAWCANQM